MFHHCNYSSHYVTTSFPFPNGRRNDVQSVSGSCLRCRLHITFLNDINGMFCKWKVWTVLGWATMRLKTRLRRLSTVAAARLAPSRCSIFLAAPAVDRKRW
ncbi:hypothetical protein NE237_012076 [Protea cynaroides]|uniref:Uncharacterized protein n=1 Tax=Protea cynaroides TaxID=273540 RepID=A0A9Q0JYW6_9MAGN|nr:hypothetical protein NE237_012076 [Protea cynaroides]